MFKSQIYRSTCGSDGTDIVLVELGLLGAEVNTIKLAAGKAAPKKLLKLNILDI
jgi:hypothetical protein